MRQTRNVFMVRGSPQEIDIVLEELQFKGAKTFTRGTPVTLSSLQEAFEENRSVICCASDLHFIPPLHQIHILITDQVLDGPDIISTALPNIVEQFQKIVLSHNCDVGDHRSNTSGVGGTPTQNDCVYCRYLNGEKAQNERIVYQSKSFFVLPTVGQFCKGYLLIIPFEHIMSNAELSQEEIKELCEVIQDIEYILRLTYHSDVLIWENGSGSSGKGKAKDSIVHSHLHIAPAVNLTAETVRTQSNFPFESTQLEYLSVYKEVSYLLVRSDYQHWNICDSSKLYVPRQYVRQLLAEDYGLFDDEHDTEKWNWRSHPYLSMMHDTVTDIFHALAHNWSSVPQRIRERVGLNNSSDS